MPELHLFEYAVVRIVPRVEREEFLNAGVILYCARQQFLQVKFEVAMTRLMAFSCESEAGELENYLHAFQRICVGGKEAGPIGLLTIAERFRWLTATRSTIIQTSKVHPGLCDEAGSMLTRLYDQLVR